MEIVEAQLERNTDSWGSMDPYCVVAYKDDEVRTKTHYKGHKTPSWKEKFPIKVTDGKGPITFTVFEEDTMSSDKVGDTTLDMERLCKKDTDQWIDILYDKKLAGKIHIRTKFEPLVKPEAKPEVKKEEPTAKQETKPEAKPQATVEETKTAVLLSKDSEPEKVAANPEEKPSVAKVVDGITANGGTLKIKVIEARLTHDTEMLGQMDPLVELKTSKGKWRTKVHQDAGKTPVWNETFEMELYDVNDTLELTVWEEDTTTYDLVGNLKMELPGLLKKDPWDTWLEIFYKKESAGKVHIEATWQPYPDGFKKDAPTLADFATKEDIPQIDFRALCIEKDQELAARQEVERAKQDELARIQQ